MPGGRLLMILLLLACSCSGPAAESGPASRPACEGVGCSLEALARDSEQREGWTVRESGSFRLFHYDAVMAERLAETAEELRREQLGKWLGAERVAAWSPRCDVYLFPNRRLLVKLTGGGSKVGSAVSSPSRLYRGRILKRRIDLAADDWSLFTHTLPHEIAHVMLVTLLGRDAPLWAHEGVATLEEPEENRQRALAFAAAEQAGGRAYSVKALMETKLYPDREYLELFYAQSFSLVDFLVKARGRPALLAFLRAAQPGGEEAALRLHYGWDYLELQKLWMQSAASR